VTGIISDHHVRLVAARGFVVNALQISSQTQPFFELLAAMDTHIGFVCAVVTLVFVVFLLPFV
jgi:hypothetical protein